MTPRFERDKVKPGMFTVLLTSVSAASNVLGPDTESWAAKILYPRRLGGFAPARSTGFPKGVRNLAILSRPK